MWWVQVLWFDLASKIIHDIINFVVSHIKIYKPKETRLIFINKYYLIYVLFDIITSSSPRTRVSLLACPVYGWRGTPRPYKIAPLDYDPVYLPESGGHVRGTTRSKKLKRGPKCKFMWWRRGSKLFWILVNLSVDAFWVLEKLRKFGTLACEHVIFRLISVLIFTKVTSKKILCDV